MSEEQSPKERLSKVEAEQLAKDDLRKKAYMEKELSIETRGKARELKQSEKRLADELKNISREKTRKEAYLKHEEKIRKSQEDRKNRSQ
jgi:hypothetical protein